MVPTPQFELDNYSTLSLLLFVDSQLLSSPDNSGGASSLSAALTLSAFHPLSLCSPRTLFSAISDYINPNVGEDRTEVGNNRQN